MREKKEQEKGSNRTLEGQEKDCVESLVTVRALLAQRAKSQIIRLLLSVKTSQSAGTYTVVIKNNHWIPETNASTGRRWESEQEGKKGCKEEEQQQKPFSWTH